MALTKALHDPAPEVRAASAHAFGQLHYRPAADMLVRLLQDSNPNVRMEAAWALGEMRVRKALEALVAALDDPEWTVRNQAAWALKTIGDPYTLPVLAQKLAAAASENRRLILWVIDGFAPDDAVHVLEPILKRSKDVELKVAVVDQIGKSKSASAFSALVGALKDPAPEVRLAAIEALVRNPHESLREMFQKITRTDSDPHVREAAQAAIKAFVAAQGVAALWTFDEKDRAVVHDATGGSTDGKVIDCTFGPGVSGAALVCSGKGYVDFGRAPDLKMAQRPFTVTAWIRPEKPTGVVIARGGAWCGFSLYILDGIPKFGIHRVKDGPTFIAAAKTPIPLKKWTHLAGVVRENKIELYLNGKFAGSAKTAGLIPSNCGQSLVIGIDTGDAPAEITDHFVGMIDEVKFWSKALTAQEIQAEYGAYARSPGRGQAK